MLNPGTIGPAMRFWRTGASGVRGMPDGMIGLDETQVDAADAGVKKQLVEAFAA